MSVVQGQVRQGQELGTWGSDSGDILQTLGFLLAAILSKAIGRGAFQLNHWVTKYGSGGHAHRF